MQNTAKRAPVLSLAISVLSLVLLPIGNMFPSLACAVVAVLLGIVGVATTRGEAQGRRVAAIVGIALGAIIMLFCGVVFYLDWSAATGAPL